MQQLSAEQRQQLDKIDKLSQDMYTSADHNARESARQVLEGLTTDVKYVDQCGIIVQHSNNVYSLMVAATSLRRLVSTFCDSFQICTI